MTRRLWPVSLVLAVIAAPLAAQTVTVSGMRARFTGAVVTDLTDAAGTVYARDGKVTSPVLRTLDGDLSVPEDATLEADPQPLPVTRDWTLEGPGNPQAQLRLTRAGTDLVVEQSGQAAPGLHGIQWAIAGIPLDYDILVPGSSGVRLDRKAPITRQEFGYPMGWEAQFVIAQGPSGGFMVWAEDARGRYKNLRVIKTSGGWTLEFETQNLAPFADKDTIESVRWHLGLHQGDWRVAARRYRDWSEANLMPTRVADQHPAWVKDQRALVICPLDLPLLDALAARMDPAQTTLYIANWRRDGYDRNYPDYTALPELEPFMQRAHALGFRVMLHVNYFGVDPRNALYEQFQRYQVRDPFTGERLWWTWERAEPPIKFAYINPACQAFRELLVSRMTELCTRYNVDALHLDQTLCIWNDMAGRVDGLTMIEGNIELHRDLREALPQVALSGEGLNEVTCRYEAFAQRHVWGLDHTGGTWNRGWLERAHPISSYVLRPYTIINGYLGMSGPTNPQLYAAWRQAYVNWGVIPTLAWPSAPQLEAPTGFTRQLLDEIAFTQRHRLDPDPDAPGDCLYGYTGANGATARYVSGQGFSLVDGDGAVVSRTVSGVDQFNGPGVIAGAMCYDNDRVFGLDPVLWYPVALDQPRDPLAFHVTSLPEGQRIERAIVTPALATLSTTGGGRVLSWIADLIAEGRTGYTVDGGEGAEQDGPLYESPGGAFVTAAGERLIHLHPPWHADRLNPETGVTEASGTGEAYALVSVTLPALQPGESLAFTGEVYMDTGAVGEGKTDGVTYTVEVVGTGPRAQVHNALTAPVPLNLDLTPLAGRKITLRLAANTGPAHSATFDWARWRDAAVVLAGPQTGTLALVSPQSWRHVISSDPNADLASLGGGHYRVKTAFPAHLFFLRDDPTPLAGPCDLTTIPFIMSFSGDDGSQLTNPQYAGAGVQEQSVEGVSLPGIAAHPPSQGSTVLDFPLVLPAGAVSFSTQVGLRDGSESEGCIFEVRVNGLRVARQRMLPGPRQSLTADLSPWAGQSVVLSLVTNSDGTFNFDWAHWGQPAIR